MKLTKRLFALALVLCMLACLCVSVFAADGEESAATTPTSKGATFTKVYKIENADTKNPEETFTFQFTADHVTDTATPITAENMPALSNVTVKFDEGTAAVSGLSKTLTVPTPEGGWSGVGVYYYKVTEVSGNTLGVTYDSNELWLKVTVAYNEATDTYYTAFVTLSLDDKDKDGKTDVKIGGFENKYSAGSLEITKDVTGNLGDRKNASFNIGVTFTVPEGKTFNGTVKATIAGTEDTTYTFTSGTKYTFALKHGQTAKFENLPYGVAYTIEEEDYTADNKGGYDAAQYKIGTAEASNSCNGSIAAASTAVTVTNNKGTTVDMGVSLDSLPYILALVLACGGAVVLFTRKRHIEE